MSPTTSVVSFRHLIATTLNAYKKILQACVSHRPYFKHLTSKPQSLFNFETKVPNVRKTLCFRTHSCGAAAMDTMSDDAGKYSVWDTQNTVWTSKEHNVGPLSLKYLHSELTWASRFSWVKVWNGSDLIKIWNIQICVHGINMLLWFDGWILDCIWTVMVPTSVIMSLKKKIKKIRKHFSL